MRTFAFLATAAILLTGCSQGQDPAPPPKAATKAPKAVAKSPTAPPKPLIIDVRTRGEWDAGHLDGAILIPYRRVPERIADVAPDKSTPIFLYCYSGARAASALDRLRKMGYTCVENIGTLENARERFAPK